jgi:hypothetical protein
MRPIKQTLEQFLETGEGSKNFEAWYRSKNAKSPDDCPLTLWSDEWFEELAIYALWRAGWLNI